MAALVILQADARVVARLYEALSGDHEVVVCSSWDSMESLMGRRSFDGCLVDADHPERHVAMREIEKLRARHGPDTSVEKLAAALGHTPRNLRQALEEADLPQTVPEEHPRGSGQAGARLGRDLRTVEDVAFSLGYTTATSLPRGRVLGKIASIVLLAVLAGCASLGGGGAGVDRAAIDAVVETPPMDRAHFGVLAVDARSGRTLYERNAHQWFVPASNQKILVTAAAWSLLGPEHRFRTEVWAAGHLSDGWLDGDLVVIASGDPSLSGRYWESGAEALRALADSIVAAGVRHVEGALLVDVSSWDSTSVPPTREVDDLAFGYGATGGAFAIDEGELQVFVGSAPWVGLPADVDWSARIDEGFVVSRVRTVPEGRGRRIVARYWPETRRIELDGAIELGAADTLSIAQRDPVRLATAVLARSLADAGVSVAQGAEVRWLVGDPIGSSCLAGAVRGCPRAHLLTAMESPTVAELSGAALAPSQNWIAEQLLLALGAERGERGSWPEGVRVLEEFLRGDVGIDSLDVSARDGSGLSRYNLVTPRALARVLQYMASRPDAAAYRAALAEPGEVDSTLEERLGGLEGRVFAKTGTLSNVNSLSGYLVREDGREVIFSILANEAGLGSQLVEGAIDDIVRVLAR